MEIPSSVSSNATPHTSAEEEEDNPVFESDNEHEQQVEDHPAVEFDNEHEQQLYDEPAIDSEDEEQVHDHPVVDHEYQDQVRAAEQMFVTILNRHDLRNFLYPQDLVRLAWNDAANHDPETWMGDGPNGSVRVLDSQDFPALHRAFHSCEEVKGECPRLTYADIFQIGAKTAMSRAGVPNFEFRPGREDDELPSISKFPDELTDGDFGLTHWIRIFHGMGLTNKEIVALMGGLKAAYDYDVEPPLRYDNSFFLGLLSDENLCSDSNRQLVEDPDFRLYVQQYAENENTFIGDYAAVHVKISERGLD